MSSIASIIEIVSLPHGDAPETVWKAWIGCVMPCDPECGHVPVYAKSVTWELRKGPLPPADFLALPPTEKIDGFSVPMEIALQILECHDPKAAAWFYSHGYPKADKCFRFKLSEVRVISTLTDKEAMAAGPMNRYDDLETGTMRRMT